MQRVNTDRRDGLAVDAQLPVVTRGVTADPRWAASWLTCAAGTPANCRSTSWAQFCP